MKKIIIIAIALIITSIGFSQDDTRGSEADWSPETYQVGKMYPGYIIKLDGDTVQGFLKADNRCSIGGIGSSNQNKVKFYLQKSDRRPDGKYKPKDIKGYKIADKVYESINFSGGLFNKPNFNLVIEDGAIRLYEWYATVENYSSLSKQKGESWEEYDARRFETRIIVAKDPEEPIEYNKLGLRFKKKMPPLIKDYPEMAKKVANKEKGYKFINLFDVIEEYNEWKAAQ